MPHSIKITFKPEDRIVYVLPGTPVVEAAARAGITVETPCGGQGSCGKCRVEVLQGAAEPTAEEKRLISAEELKKGIRLACQSRICKPAVIHIPLESRFSAQKILTTGMETRKEIHPSVEKFYREFPSPTLGKSRADLEIIRQAFPQNFKADIHIIRQLPQVLKKSGFKVTCVFSDGELISVEEGDTSKDNFGISLDLGTTTMVATLLNLSSGKDLAISTKMNPQVIYGDDVISRINFCLNNKKGLDELHYRTIEAVNEMVEELARAAKINPKNIYKLTVTGNSTMQHLLLKISPESLGSIPFSLVIKEGVEVKAKSVGIQINPQGCLCIFPNIAGFVGGDTVSVILAAGIYRSDEIQLIVDIGTNGEIILGNRERLLTASTAAGPAFEGARISSGMRASTGAIEKVVVGEDVEVNVVGDVLPFGICGTALIDAVAELLRLGIIDETGKICSQKELKGKVSDKLLRRIVENESSCDFLLVEKEATRSKRPIFITQKDVREVQLAKAAIAAGIKILMKELGISEEEISEILLAGAFGNFIRRNHAKRIGLIPDVVSSRIRFIGNAASSGAKLALLSRRLEKEVGDISKDAEYIELSTRPDFQEEFVEAMSF
jgi:uncharacterized 2Fe-2S/4Fe-4S cluster protein (DUF4445 family)